LRTESGDKFKYLNHRQGLTRHHLSIYLNTCNDMIFSQVMGKAHIRIYERGVMFWQVT